jgi:hypothetical protein
MEIKEKSLLHFCNTVGIDISHVDQNLANIKKLIQLEFKSSKDGIITLDGLEYDQNYINNRLEDPLLLNTLHYEQEIKNISWLNAFINKNKFEFPDDIFDEKYVNNFENVYAIPPHLDNKDFASYLSPKLAKAFNLVSKDLLENNLFYKHRLILYFLKYIQIQHHEDSLKFIRITLNNALKTFRNSNKNNYKNHINEIERWTINNAGNFISKLPDGLLSEKTDFTRSVTNFIVDIQNEDRDLTFKLSLQLIKIDGLPSDLEVIVKNNHDFFTNLYYQKDLEGPKGSEEVPWAKIIIITIFLLRILLYFIMS